MHVTFLKKKGNKRQWEEAEGAEIIDDHVNNGNVWKADKGWHFLYKDGSLLLQVTEYQGCKTVSALFLSIYSEFYVVCYVYKWRGQVKEGVNPVFIEIKRQCEARHEHKLE